MATITTAAIIESIGSEFALTEVELDDLQPHEVLVRVVAAGVCGTDMHVQGGGIPFPLPGVVGHEGAGVVEAIGSAITTVEPGDQVLMSFTSCGTCRNCRTAHPALCDEFLSLNLLGGRRADGSCTVSRNGEGLNAHFFAQSSFAHRAIADERGLTKVPKSADLTQLAPLGCGIQTGAGAVFNVIRPMPGDTVVIFGAGAVGLAAAMAAALSPATQIVVVDLVDARLKIAREIGATRVVNSAIEDVADVVTELTGGRGADAVIDATGVIGVLEGGPGLVAPGGVIASIGAPPPGVTVALDVNYMLNGRRYIGITEGDAVSQVLLPALVELMEQGRFPVEKLIRHYDFTNINEAAKDLTSGAVVKPVLLFPDS